jgi:hypothetical protein
MLLPGFADGFRAPARFAMLAALGLSAAAALALARLTPGLANGTRAVITGVVALGVLADGLVYPVTFEPAPAPLDVPAAVPADAAVLELPIGVFEDAAAMYHGTQHGRPVANGLSGFEPPHYAALRGATRDGDTGAVEMLAVDRPLAVFLSRPPAASDLASLLPRQSRARHLATTATHEVYLVDAGARATAQIPEAARSIPLLDIAPSSSAAEVGRMRDGERRTAWLSAGPQRGGESVTVTLEERQMVRGVMLALGAFPSGFPRELSIEVSTDDGGWRVVWQGPTGARTVSAALDDPREVRMVIEFAPVEARLVRLTQTGRSLDDSWAIAEMAILR